MDEIRATPRFGLLGTVADGLLGAKRFANRAQIPAGVPLVGGQGLGDLTLGQLPEELDNWSYGDLPMTMPPAGTGSRVPVMKSGRADGVADAAMAAMPAGGLLGKGGSRALAASVPSGAGPVLRAEQLGAITPEGRAKLLQALQQRGVDQPFRVGILEPNAQEALSQARAQMGWGSSPTRDVFVGPRDVRHMLKRIDENGMDPSDLVRMAESVLAPDALASVSPMGGRINLTGAEILNLPPGGSAPAVGRLTSRRDARGPSLYGLMPGEGWDWKR